MKRTPLVRRTPLRRTGPLERVPIRRRRPANPIPLDVRREVHARSRGRCEINAPGCTGTARHLHHRLPRSAGGRHTWGNLVDACVSCHAYVHANPERAYAAGWLIRRGGNP